jgi:2,3-bisphosphoglycerate-dependent phosphoglycerate mutase
VLVVAHGNSLRGLVKFLDNIADDDIPGFELPTGRPLIYDMDEMLRSKGSWF